MHWNMICRICLESGEMVSLFDSDENNELLSDKYTYCCDISVSENDPLPTLICLECADKLLLSYKFKRQCIQSSTTLKECLDEFTTSTGAKPEPPKDVETITIKQENGVFLQYELPVEKNNSMAWTTRKFSIAQPAKRGRGRPRKYVDSQGNMEVSPYKKRKKPAANDDSVIKNEPVTDGEVEDIEANEGEFSEDPDYIPGGDTDDESKPIDDAVVEIKRGRPKKKEGTKRERKRKKRLEENGEDIMLREALLAGSEPLLLAPKQKKKTAKKKSGASQRDSKPLPPKSHTCDTCGSAFRTNAVLQAHIRRHLGIKPFACSICEYTCVLRMELKRHMFRHTGVKPYKCRICERSFSDFGSRQKHERLHMGERPYVCNLCGKAFGYSYVLSNHMLTHTGEKKYSCEPCNKKFTKAHHLKYHNKVHHKELYLRLEMESQARKFRQQIKIDNPETLELLTGENMQNLFQTAEGVNLLRSGGEQYVAISNEEEQEKDFEETNASDSEMVMLASDLNIQKVTDESGETKLIYQLPPNFMRQNSNETNNCTT